MKTSVKFILTFVLLTLFFCVGGKGVNLSACSQSETSFSQLSSYDSEQAQVFDDQTGTGLSKSQGFVFFDAEMGLKSASETNSYSHNFRFRRMVEAFDLQFQMGKLYYEKGAQSDTLKVVRAERMAALVSADSVFAVIAQAAPDSYLGNFWRARTNSALDPETTQGLAKPYYEQVVTFLTSKNDPRYNAAFIECYSYLGYYYLVANKLAESKEFWNKILAIDLANATAKRALDGIK